MPAFTVYDAASGQIRRIGTASETSWSRQAQDGEAVMQGHGDAATQYVAIATPEFRIRPAVRPFPGGPAPHVLAMDDLPAGTRVCAINNAGQRAETADPADPIRLVVPGVYAVEIDPPFPFVPVRQDCEVSIA